MIERAELLTVLKAIGSGRTIDVVVAVLESEDARGLSQSEIERATGLDRRTVSRALEHAATTGVLEINPVKARIRYRVGRMLSGPQTGKNSTIVDSESHNETGINSTMVEKIHQSLADAIHNGGENPPNGNGAQSGTGVALIGTSSEEILTSSLKHDLEHDGRDADSGESAARSTAKPKSKRGERGIADPKTAEAFERWWDSYGLKTGLQATIKLFVSIPREDWPLLKAATDAYVRATDADPEATGSRLRQRRDPERFLKRDYWREWVAGDPRKTAAPAHRPAPKVYVPPPQLVGRRG